MSDHQRENLIGPRLLASALLVTGLVAAIASLRDETGRDITRATDPHGPVFRGRDAGTENPDGPFPDFGAFAGDAGEFDGDSVAPPDEDSEDLRRDDILSNFDLSDAGNLYHGCVVVWEIPKGKLKSLADFMHRYEIDPNQFKESIKQGLAEGDLAVYHLAQMFAAEMLDLPLDVDSHDEAMRAAVQDYLERHFDFSAASQALLDAAPEVNRGLFDREFAGNEWLEFARAQGAEGEDAEAMFDTATFELTRGLYNVGLIVLQHPAEGDMLIDLFLGALLGAPTAASIADEIDGLLAYWDSFPVSQTAQYFSLGGMEFHDARDILSRFSQLLRTQ